MKVLIIWMVGVFVARKLHKYFEYKPAVTVNIWLLSWVYFIYMILVTVKKTAK